MKAAIFSLVLAILVSGALAAPVQSAAAVEKWDWQQLAPIPDQEGFAAPFAGVSNGTLIVGGGANIVGDRWADSFTKKWYDDVFVLERPDGAWKRAGRLPRPLGYGVSISAEEGMICIGGSDLTRHYREVFRLTWQDGKVSMWPMASLPQVCANACGTIVGRTIYVAGGIETPTATTALRTFWALNLDDASGKWQELEPWPGPERMLAVAGAQDGCFFLFSGAKLSASADGKPVREFLRDAYRFRPGKGWERIADLPRPAVAAPSPALSPGSSRLVVLTGDDGTNVAFQPIEKHPGFPRTMLAYDTKSDGWQIIGETPFSRATVPVVQWQRSFIVPNGEVRPRVRTPEVWMLPAP